MIKKGIVKNVQPNGTWEGQYGLMYKFEVTIGDDTGQTMSKSDKCRFEVGQETKYEFIDGKYPKIKPISDFEYKSSFASDNNKSTTNTDRETLIVRQSTLKCATDFVCNNGGSPADVVEIAELFSDWVLNGEKPKTDDTNDMPF